MRKFNGPNVNVNVSWSFNWVSLSLSLDIFGFRNVVVDNVINANVNLDEMLLLLETLENGALVQVTSQLRTSQLGPRESSTNSAR